MSFLYYRVMLPYDYRLKKETDIKKLFSKGKGVFDTKVGTKIRKNGLGQTRFVIVVGVKVHKRAFRRNRIRRRVRAILEEHLSHIAPDYDVAIIARPEALTASYKELEVSVLSALKKVGVLDDVPRL